VWRALAPEEERLLGDRLDASEEAEALCRPLRPSEPHVVVATLGVRPDHRRRGIATRLMSPVLAAASTLGVPVYLETSSEENVALYTGIGFETTGRIDVPGGGPTVWGMRRDG